MSRRGNTMIELVTLLAVMAIIAAIAVPTASGARRALAGKSGAQRLALVLMTAQAQAQAQACRVDVTVTPAGAYEVSLGASHEVERGEFGAGVVSNYPGDSLSFNSSGSPCVLATTTPRAGSFTFGSAAGCTVVVQLGGCIRCR